jgi:nitroimidazol reductase NimA-like FMN-containing flavoprotein (pyridoxamine 5'-phosphate oxidase superfamily)
MDAATKAKYIIEHNNFMTISTANASGKPWISPVGFVYDDNYNLYWVSYKNALHSTNIQNRPEVAIVVFGQMPEGNYDGVYIDATATELTDEADIQHGIDLFKARRPQPVRFEAKTKQDVSGEAAWRMYKAVTVAVSKRADDIVNGQAITVRETVQLQS